MSGRIRGFNIPPITELATEYSLRRFVALPELIAPEQADALLRSMQSVATRRVICGDATISWDEKDFYQGHPCYDFFEQPEALGLVTALSGLRQQTALMSWASIYRTGEYINPHKDRAGTIHLLTCAEAPPGPENGGELVVGGRSIFLHPGAAIAFDATHLEHYTTPLTSTPDMPEPRRTVLVGRYFLE